MTSEPMRCFADAARAFCEAGPWRHLTDVGLIAVESPGGVLGDRAIVYLRAVERRAVRGFLERDL